MKATILIPCHNGTKYKRLIEDLKNQSEKDFEVIFMDSYETERFEQPKLKKQEDNFRYYSCGNPVAFKRNQAIELSNSDWIIFIDDDVSLPKDWLKGMLEIKEKKKIISGQVLTCSPKDYLEDVWAVASCNIILEKETLKLNSFNEKYPHACFEDTCWGHGCFNKGIPSAQRVGGTLFHMPHERKRFIRKAFLFGVEDIRYQRDFKIFPKRFLRTCLQQGRQIVNIVLYSFGSIFGIIKYIILRRK